MRAGKNFLDEMARELGLNLQINEKAPEPRPEPGIQYNPEEEIPVSISQKPDETVRSPRFQTENEPLSYLKDRKPLVDAFPAEKGLKIRKKSELLRKLALSDSVREALILKTILDKPLALRGRQR
ncbi:hypothetical protein ACFL5V_01325 [Fibrobacterota bacterium]